MNKKYRILSVIFIILSVCVLCGSFIFLLSNRTNIKTFPARDTTQRNFKKKSTRGLPGSSYVVNPISKLDELIRRYMNQLEYQRNIDQMTLELLKLKDSGHTNWGSQNWMKDPNYYRSLNTFQLVEDCFSRPIFAFEMTIHNDPIAGFENLRIFHNGFAELFNRKDLWKGILYLYKHLSSKLDTQADLEQIVTTSGHFDALERLYGLSPFREQVKGREGLFLAANLRAIKRFRWYLDNYDAQKLGTEGTPGFFGEPCQVVIVALMLAKQVDPKKYNSIEPEITSVRWTKEQDVQQLKDFLDLVITDLEEFTNVQSENQLDKILLEASPRNINLK